MGTLLTLVKSVRTHTYTTLIIIKIMKIILAGFVSNIGGLDSVFFMCFLIHFLVDILKIFLVKMSGKLKVKLSGKNLGYTGL